MSEENKASAIELLEENNQLKLQLSEMYASSNEMMKSKSELESILHNAGEGVIIFNPDGTVKSLNRQAERIFGYSEVELMFQHVLYLFDAPQKYAEHVPLFLKKFLKEHPKSEEYPLYGINSSGNKVPLAIAVSEVASEEMMFFDDFSDDVGDDVEVEVDEMEHNFELFACIFHDLSGDMAAKQKLAEQNQQLEHAYLKLTQSEHLKGEFLAKISHELLTPLNGILGMAELLSLEVSKENKEYVDVIQSSGLRLNGIINNILAFDKEENGDQDVKHNFDIIEIVSNIATAKSEYIKKKNLDFKFINDFPEQQFRIYGLEQNYRNLIDCLIDNAIKFTEEGSVILSISLKNKNKNNEINVSIYDTGIGIEESKLEDIFKPFTQLEDTVTRKYGGVGMGLAIVKQIVDSENGQIKIVSELGKGSTFSVLLPLETSDNQTSSISSIDEQKVLELKELLEDDFKTFMQTIQQDFEAHLDIIFENANSQSCKILKNEFSMLLSLCDQVGATKLINLLEELQATIREDSEEQWINEKIYSVATEIQQLIVVLSGL